MSAPAGVLIRDLTADDHAAWRPLWNGYCTFYEAVVPEAVTAATWAGMIDPAHPVFGRVACTADGMMIGFAHHVLHPTTWTASPACYLEDLFVDPAARSGGIGRALIDDLVTMAGARGWSRLYWHTQGDNDRARRLYDSYVAADTFVRYRIGFSR